MLDQQLIDLRQHSLEVAGKFLAAQRAYLDASQVGRPHEELSRLAQVAALAAKQHGAALETMLNFLSTTANVQNGSDEIERTKNLIHAAAGEEHSFRQLVSHHASEARRKPIGKESESMTDKQKEPPQPPPSREEKLPPPEDSPDSIKLPGTPQPPVVPDEDEPGEQH